jgi:Rrf2 family transcriptional regulator, cysteine metabolism repressor
MLFSAKAEYACVAMLELAARQNEPKPARLSDIADKHGIPPRFLVQILLDLKHAGLVASTRGAAGGYALARLPEEISMYDVLNVVDPTEQHARPDDPLQSTNYVNGIRSVWDRIVDMQKEILKESTLASLLEQSHGLQYVI